MTTSRTAQWLTGLVAVWVFSVVGCDAPSSSTTAQNTSQSSDHDHDHHDHDGDHHDHDHDGDHHDHDGEHHDHDHHDHAHEGHDHDFKDLASAMVEIEELSAKITDAFASGTPQAAHGELHHIGEVLSAAEKIVESPDFDAEMKTEAAQAIEALFDSFGALDAPFHGDQGEAEAAKIDLDPIKESIDSAMATLKKVAAPKE